MTQFCKIFQFPLAQIYITISIFTSIRLCVHALVTFHRFIVFTFPGASSDPLYRSDSLCTVKFLNDRLKPRINDSMIYKVDFYLNKYDVYEGYLSFRMELIFKTLDIHQPFRLVELTVHILSSQQQVSQQGPRQHGFNGFGRTHQF